VAEGADAGVAAHYGDPMREQRLLTEGLAAVDLSHRGVVTITGPDRLSWLHSMTTQALTGLAPGIGTESLVLSPKGHIEHALHVVDDGATTWLTVEPGTSEALVAWLERMRFMLRVEVADVTDRYAVVGEPFAEAAAAGEPTRWVDLARSRRPGAGRSGGEDRGIRAGGGHPAQGRRWREAIVPRADLAAIVGDRPLAGMWAAEALRVAAWRPRLGFETDHRTIVQELDWLRSAVHLHKGCYRGQETVARVHNLGNPPRRVVFLHLDGSGHVLPERGAEVRLVGGTDADSGTSNRPVGCVTSVARHYEIGPIALAVVKRSLPVDRGPRRRRWGRPRRRPKR
jgi:folate-binding protein YgfZ